MNPDDATVVICTYTEERWDDLRAAVDSVRAQSSRPAELLLVVDHADHLLERARHSFPDARCVPNTGVRGLSGARNTAVAEVRTPVIAFLDDDAVADPDWLAEMIGPYADACVLGSGGQLVPRWDIERPRWFPAEFDWVVGCTYVGSRTEPGPVRNPLGASMSFRTEVLQGIGGFSCSLGRVGSRPVGCEETEACMRAASAYPGGVFWYVPTSIAHHRVRDERGTWSYFRSRCLAEGISKARVSRLSSKPLESERTYATKVLPRAMASNLRHSWSERDLTSLLRAAALGGGLGLTTAGYLAGGVMGVGRRDR